MGLSVLDEIEAMLGLPSPAPVIDREGRPALELRREINEHNRFFREEYDRYDREPDSQSPSVEASRELDAPKPDHAPPRRSRARRNDVERER